MEEGIILEDDCLPSFSFFEFCKYALKKFREDTRIGTISGDYFLPPDLFFEQPYYFSKYFQIWAWATWRRAWQKYRFDLSFESEENWPRFLRVFIRLCLEAEYWLEVFRGLKKGPLIPGISDDIDFVARTISPRSTDKESGEQYRLSA